MQMRQPAAGWCPSGQVLQGHVMAVKGDRSCCYSCMCAILAKLSLRTVEPACRLMTTLQRLGPGIASAARSQMAGNPLLHRMTLQQQPERLMVAEPAFIIEALG